MIKKIKLRLAAVAREAGVSVATVDRVIHGRPGVKPHTAEHILSVIERMENGNPGNSAVIDMRRDNLNFDIILPIGTNAIFNSLEEEIREYANRPTNSGLSVRIHRIKGFDPDALAENIDIISRQTNGIAIVAIESPQVREAVNRVVQMNIPLVTLVSDLSGSRRMGYIGLDNRAGGRTAGYLMGRFLAGTKGTVLMLAGSPLLRDHEEREMGFRRVLGEGFGNIDIISYLEDRDDDETAYQQVKRTIEKHSDLVGIYDIGAGTQGIARALTETGHDDDIVFIGHELTRYSREFLIDGVMDAVIDQVPRKEARMLVDMLERLARGENAGYHSESAPISVYFRENLP
ncbi:MAG: LacI family transcriptional regulator [Gammaproteobacteria bacterium]|nr:LacI family transcriptional regulator [Gammaproteobacteria bacterium]